MSFIDTIGRFMINGAVQYHSCLNAPLNSHAPTLFETTLVLNLYLWLEYCSVWSGHEAIRNGFKMELRFKNGY